MDRLLRWAAILAGKTAIFLSRLIGNQGTDIPGKIARRIYPRILIDLGRNIDGPTIMVTGTNGKTTTTNMIAEIMKQNNSSYVHNQAGANMLTGITTAFIKASNLTGSRHFDYALLETDEANVPLLLNELRVDFLLITNFFRDQLDRYGELDHTINLIKDAVKGSQMELILNADDPLMVHFQDQTGLKCWYYGFQDTRYDSIQGAASREGRFCVICGHQLNYRRYHYAQLGSFECPRCHSRNPACDFCGGNLDMSAEISMTINDMPIRSPYKGFYNAYNVLAAIALSKILVLPDEIIQKAIASFRPSAGRMETFFINGKKTILILVKNPTGLNQSLTMVASDPAAKNLFIALNDNAADGRDISWIWDADFEPIIDPTAAIGEIICSGQRSGDMAVRIKYAGFDTEKITIETGLREGIEKAVYGDSKISYILSTYTALFQCRKILVKLQKKSPVPVELQQQAQRTVNGE
ncbi:MAG: MurT ligase domain-containing protein [Syntrophomonadaceae bacterium]|jgi:UDP-N-acetylmuramyl tripeptide synthase